MLFFHFYVDYWSLQRSNATVLKKCVQIRHPAESRRRFHLEGFEGIEAGD